MATLIRSMIMFKRLKAAGEKGAIASMNALKKRGQ